MYRTKISAILLLCLPLVLSQNNTTTESSSETTMSTQSPPEIYEFVIKLVFGLEIEKIPEFILDSIWDYSNNITTEDVLSLYNLEALNLTSTIRVLEELHYDPSIVLSINGLERFLSDYGVEFKDLYNAVSFRSGIIGLPLRTFLVNLGIKTGEFSDAITFGVGDPLMIFKDGNFSQKNLDSALQSIDKNQDDLFVACRNEILSITKLKPLEELFNILKTHNFDKIEAMNLWKILKLDVEDIENHNVFSDLLNQLKFNLENASYLGLLTSNKVAINKQVYKIVSDKMQLSKIFATSLYDNTTVELKEEKLQHYENIVTLRLETDNFTTFIEVATTTKDLKNCQFVSLENDTVTNKHVEKVIYKGNILEVSTEEFNTTELLQGSPLICNNKVYGLAKEINADNIIFDTFLIHSGVARIVFNPFVLVICFLIFLRL